MDKKIIRNALIVLGLAAVGCSVDRTLDVPTVGESKQMLATHEPCSVGVTRLGPPTAAPPPPAPGDIEPFARRAPESAKGWLKEPDVTGPVVPPPPVSAEILARQADYRAKAKEFTATFVGTDAERDAALAKLKFEIIQP